MATQKKLIKFDLNINNEKVRSLDALQENITDEIIDHYKRGILARWLECFEYSAEAERIRSISVSGDKDILITIGEALGVEIDEPVAEYLLEARQVRQQQGEEQVRNSADVQEAPLVDEGTPTNMPVAFESMSEEEQLEFAATGTVPDDIQDQISKEGTPELRTALAGNPHLSNKAALAYLYKTGSEDIIEAIARNPATGRDIQLQLADSDDWRIRAALASNPSLLEELHSRFEEDSDNDVKAAFAENSSLSPTRQQALYKKDDDRIKLGLAANKSLSASIQLLLLKEQHAAINVALAGNPGIAEDVVAKMLAANDDVRESLAANSALPVIFQRELAKDQSIKVRAALYKNPIARGDVKKIVAESFSDVDLKICERDFEYAENKHQEKSNEAYKAQQEIYEYTCGIRIFRSESKEEELRRRADRLEKREHEYYQELVRAERLYNDVKGILASRAEKVGDGSRY